MKYCEFSDRLFESPTKLSGIAYKVVQYDGPTHSATRILNQTIIRARDRNDLLPKLKAWMDAIGLDPEDEDDYGMIAVTAG